MAVYKLVNQRAMTLSLMLTGAVSGVSFALNLLVKGGVERSGSLIPGMLPALLLTALGFAVFMLCLRTLVRRLVRISSLPESVRARYPKYDIVTYLPFLVFALGAFGLRFPTLTSFLLLGVVFLLLQAALLAWLAPADVRARTFTSLPWLALLFFLSGFSALIYQVVWQRALFASFGVNIESVTVVVSLFMFGLGVGSLVGGLLSKRFPQYSPHLFFLCEAGIGVFGLLSMPLIEMVGAATLYGSLWSVSLVVYAVLSVPTVCMGATLPILVGHLNRHYENMGRSVGLLYFINTAGSAVASLITADLVFVFLGQRGAVLVAAIGNLLVAVLVYRYTRRLAHNPRAGEMSLPHDEVIAPSPARGRWQFLLILILAAATGFISLSQEILWFRVISYTTGGQPTVFAHLLGFLLCGIAFGALVAKRVCEARRDYTLPFIAIMLTLSGIFYYFSVPLTAYLMTVSPTLGLNSCYLAVAVTALLVGSVFPVLCHYGIKTKASAGLLLSWVYFANILGATAGPLLTGFVLLDVFTFEQLILFLSMATVGLGGTVLLAACSKSLPRTAFAACVPVAAVCLVFVQDHVFVHILEKLHYKTGYAEKRPYKLVVQNRSGIIAVEAAHPDLVFGGGVYDSKINLDPTVSVDENNHIRQAYWFAALHPAPADVLLIGMSSGSWARVVTDHLSVKTCTIVEINPGYVDLIRKYPELDSLLTDPKVTIHVDDGRRWLRRQPEAKFDVIIMDATSHWRDHSTNLLSVEFLKLCQERLKGGGVFYLNTTGCEDVVYTAATVFKHVVRYNRFAAVSDSPFAMTMQEKRENLLRFVRDGRRVFDPDLPGRRAVLEQLAARDTQDKAPQFRSRSDLWFITDDNMAPEFKKTNRWINRPASWGEGLVEWLGRPLASLRK